MGRNVAIEKDIRKLLRWLYPWKMPPSRTEADYRAGRTRDAYVDADEDVRRTNDNSLV